MQGGVDRAIAETAAGYDLVIVGRFRPRPDRAVVDRGADRRNARFLAVNAQSNSANLGYNLITKYPRADYVCIDAPEARLAVSDRVASGRRHRAPILVEEHIDCRNIIVTQGKHGCVTYERGGIAHTIPAFAKNVVDTLGAATRSSP